MRCTVAFALAASALAGCGGDTSARPDAGFDLYDAGPDDSGGGGFGGFGGGFGGSPSSGNDADRDGLCDETEGQIGSDADTADTDGDGLPDVIELLYGFTLTDPLSPAPDRIARLEGKGNAELRFPVRFTVEGESTDFIGFFEDATSPYDDGSSAGQYLESSIAIGAEPPEAARVVDGPRQRFLAVLGTARLELEIRFVVPSDEDPAQCARAYQFIYGLREDGGGSAHDRSFILIVAGAGMDAAEDFCLPTTCF